MTAQQQIRDPGLCLGLATVPAKADLAQVAVRGLDAEPMPNADDRPLNRGVEALGGVGAMTRPLKDTYVRQR